MSEESTTANKPKWFLAISIFALIWNLLGVFAYIAQMMITPEILDTLPEAERTIIENTPSWAISAFAVAVWGGALGSLLLLLKKKIAVYVLALSFVGVLVQLYHSIVIANSIAVYGPGDLIMPIMVLLIGGGLIWYSNDLTKKGWLK